MAAEQKIKDLTTQLDEKPDGLSLLENELKWTISSVLLIRKSGIAHGGVDEVSTLHLRSTNER